MTEWRPECECIFQMRLVENKKGKRTKLEITFVTMHSYELALLTKIKRVLFVEILGKSLLFLASTEKSIRRFDM